ncbi:MAG: hypothetical protein HY295_03405 [Thaumarchaeota archaeon]|nr:hypothetical protein [Nitrososphaerota archaeon]
MEEPELPKFSWGKTFEYNCGHNKNEWGISNEDDKEEPSIKFIVAYTIKGNLANVDTHGFLTSHLPTKIRAD